MTYAQDVPGVSAGIFFESRIENKIDNTELSFNYYGVRLKARDERFIEGFVDLGIQELDLKGFNADNAGAFGLGGTLWVTRSEDGIVPADLGIYSSYHVATYKLNADSGASTDAKYGRFMVQGVVRAFESGVIHPYLRAGILTSRLDPENEDILSSNGLSTTKPAVNVGAEFDINERMVLSLEGNYSESVGGAVRLDYWF